MERLVQAWSTPFVWWWAIALFLLLAIFETVCPSRGGSSTVIRRWGQNFALYAVGIGVLYLVKPSEFATRLIAAADEGSLFAALWRIGGSGLILVVGILLADLVTFLLHRAEHRFFILWRIHIVHHTDQQLDLTTGLRHHPSEVLFNALVAGVVLSALGQPLWATGVYATLLTSMTLFNHSNIVIPVALDGAIRWLLVTPSLHRVHHSLHPAHYNTNFGNIFSIWDRLCGTYCWIPPEQPIEFGIADLGKAPVPRILHEWLLPLTLRYPEHS